MQEEIVNCVRCGAYIDLALGAYPDDWNLAADGSKDEPRSPGAFYDTCANCEIEQIEWENAQIGISE